LAVADAQIGEIVVSLLADGERRVDSSATEECGSNAVEAVKRKQQLREMRNALRALSRNIFPDPASPITAYCRIVQLLLIKSSTISL
jgi:hypothetical protein